MALPVYVGKMIYVGNWAASAIQRDMPSRIDLDPDFLLSVDELRHHPPTGGRVVFRDISNSTNERSFISALLPGLFPCGNVLPVIEPSQCETSLKVELETYLSSLAFDWATRQRMSGTHLNWHIAESLGLPPPGSAADYLCTRYVPIALSGVHFAGEWLRLSHVVSWPRLHACSPQERLRIVAMVDAVVANIMGFSISDLQHILVECDHPSGDTHGRNPKGFWRVDKDKPPELRHTVLTLVAFHDLEAKIEDAGGDREKGIAAFLTQNHGEGWMLPETLRLADYGLGHDERALHAQPVASRLGPRFYDWQLVQSAEESWRECHLHARNLLGHHEYALLLVDLIAHRAADGEDYLALLMDEFTRELLGGDGYTTVLVEIRARNVAEDDTYWPLVGALRNDGHLDDTAYGRLLDGLHARSLLDDVGYRRRRGYIPRSPSAESYLRVAEDRADYQASTPPKDPQPDLFE